MNSDLLSRWGDRDTDFSGSFSLSLFLSTFLCFSVSLSLSFFFFFFFLFLVIGLETQFALENENADGTLKIRRQLHLSFRQKNNERELKTKLIALFIQKSTKTKKESMNESINP